MHFTLLGWSAVVFFSICGLVHVFASHMLFNLLGLFRLLRFVSLLDFVCLFLVFLPRLARFG